MNDVVKRRIIWFVGYPLFFLICFVAFFVLTFPVSRFESTIKDQIEGFLGRDTSIGSISISFLGKLVLSHIEIKVPEEEPETATIPMPSLDDEDEEDSDTEDKQSDEGEGKEKKAETKKKPPLKYAIDEITVDVSLIGLIFSRLDFGVGIDALDGHVAFAYEGPLPNSDKGTSNDQVSRAKELRNSRLRGINRTRGATQGNGQVVTDGETKGDGNSDSEKDDENSVSISMEAKGIDLRKIHDLQNKLPLPLSGKVDVRFNIESPSGEFSGATGNFSFSGNEIVFGKGKSQIEVSGMPISVDEIRLGDLAFNVDFKNGIGEVKNFKIKSKDLDANVNGTVTLASPLSRSRLDLYITFKILDAYAAKSPAAKMMVENMASFSSDMRRALRTDGFYGFTSRGFVDNLRFQASKNDPRDTHRPDRRNRQNERNQNRRSRDNLTRKRPSGVPDPAMVDPITSPSGLDRGLDLSPNGNDARMDNREADLEKMRQEEAETREKEEAARREAIEKERKEREEEMKLREQQREEVEEEQDYRNQNPDDEQRELQNQPEMEGEANPDEDMHHGGQEGREEDPEQE